MAPLEPPPPSGPAPDPIREVGAPTPERHVTVTKGDYLHLHGAVYRVTGSVALGMPIREITYHLEAAGPVPEPTALAPTADEVLDAVLGPRNPSLTDQTLLDSS